MEINLNENVKVVLTKRGAEILNEREEQCANIIPNYRKKLHNEGDVYRTQLWGLFEKFGSEIHIGMNIPFEKITLSLKIE